MKSWTRLFLGRGKYIFCSYKKYYCCKVKMKNENSEFLSAGQGCNEKYSKDSDWCLYCNFRCIFSEDFLNFKKFHNLVFNIKKKLKIKKK